MARKPYNLGGSPRQKSDKTSLMSKGGINTRDLSQLLDTNFAQKISNLLIDGEGELVKRSGLEAQATVTLTNDFTFNEQYYNNVKIVGYDNTVSVIDTGTGAEIVIKSDFSGGSPVSGQVYGNYFFVGTGANYAEKIGRISITIDYDAQSDNFATGEILTGGTSWATAIILEDSDSGTSGTLTLGNITGIFSDGETITDSATGSATVDWVLGYAYEQITASPKAKIVYAFLAPTGSSAGSRLFTLNEKGDRAQARFSDIDTGSNPPWDTWTVSALADTGATYTNRNHGAGTTLASIGEQIVVGYEFGDAGFRIQITDIWGTTSKITPSDYDNNESGMAQGAITTSLGVFYGVEGSGFFQMLSGGSTNIPYSRNSKEISLALGDSYFEDVSLADLSITHDTKRHLILFAFRKDSATNNMVLAYNTDTQSWIELPMNISEFTKKEETIYGTSSVSGKYYEIFKGDSDDGKSIPTEYQQEINLLGLNSLFDLWAFEIQARLGEGSEHYIDYQIYDKDGSFVANPIEQMTITGETPIDAMLSWGSASFGSSGWGSGAEGASVRVLPYETTDCFIPEVWRLSIRLTSNDKLPASINFFSATIVDRNEKLLLNNIT